MIRLCGCALLLAACGGEEVPAAPTSPQPDAAVADAAGPDGALPPAEVVFTPPADPGIALASASAGFGGQLALWVRDQQTGAAQAADAERPVFSGTLLGLQLVLAYVRAVDEGVVSPETTVRLEAHHIQAGGAINSDVNRAFLLEKLAESIIRYGDRTAEALLAEHVPVDVDLGLGRYLAPCALHRAFATRVDPRFADLDCPRLSRWMATRADADAGFEVGQVTADERSAAWAEVTADGTATGTARAWGELLARVAGGAFGSRAASDHARSLLANSPGDGGGGDAVPAAAWVSAFNGTLHRGRHWVGIVHEPGHTTVVVVLTDAHPRAGLETTPLFGRVAAAAHGAELVWPPEAAELPEWVVDALLVAGADPACSEQDFDGLLACHRAAGVSGYALGEQSAVSVFLRGGPEARVGWFWTDPEGARRRYQVRFSPGGWWVWTRTFPLETAGDWHAGVYVNGEPYLSRFFPVR